MKGNRPKIRKRPEIFTFSGKKQKSKPNLGKITSWGTEDFYINHFEIQKKWGGQAPIT